jgi:hypothetical protein
MSNEPEKKLESSDTEEEEPPTMWYVVTQSSYLFQLCLTVLASSSL